MQGLNSGSKNFAFKVKGILGFKHTHFNGWEAKIGLKWSLTGPISIRVKLENNYEVNSLT